MYKVILVIDWGNFYWLYCLSENVYLHVLCLSLRIWFCLKGCEVVFPYAICRTMYRAMLTSQGEDACTGTDLGVGEPSMGCSPEATCIVIQMHHPELWEMPW